MLRRWAIVIVSPFGTPAWYFATGSSSPISPSSTSWRITVAVIVFVLLPTRKYSVGSSGISAPTTAVPKDSTHRPSPPLSIRTTAPGMALSLSSCSITGRSVPAKAGSSACAPLTAVVVVSAGRSDGAVVSSFDAPHAVARSTLTARMAGTYRSLPRDGFVVSGVRVRRCIASPRDRRVGSALRMMRSPRRAGVGQVADTGDDSHRATAQELRSNYWPAVRPPGSRTAMGSGGAAPGVNAAARCKKPGADSQTRLPAPRRFGETIDRMDQRSTGASAPGNVTTSNWRGRALVFGPDVGVSVTVRSSRDSAPVTSKPVNS